MAQVVPSLLMLRSFSNFRAAAMMCLSLPTDSYPIQRACLESAGYANLIAAQTELSALWLKRDEDPQAKSRFTNRAVREAIEARDQRLGAIYQDLYERTIDFGAHPNEKSVVANIAQGSVGTGNIQVRMLAGDDVMLDHGLRTCAQVGICSLKVLNLVFGPQFAAQALKRKSWKRRCRSECFGAAWITHFTRQYVRDFAVDDVDGGKGSASEIAHHLGGIDVLCAAGFVDRKRITVFKRLSVRGRDFGLARAAAIAKDYRADSGETLKAIDRGSVLCGKGV
jgi:hypothetical protein